MNKKGFLYTLGLSLVLLALLGLGILFLRQAALEQERNAESGLSLKVWDKYTSIEKTIAEMFINTGIFLNSSKGTTTYREPLPHDFTQFDDTLEILADNLEGNFSNSSIDLSKMYDQKHRVIFQPINLHYTHFEPAAEDHFAKTIRLERNLLIKWHEL